MKELKLTIYKNDQDKLIDFETNKFLVSTVQRAGDMEAVLKLHSLKMHDYLFTYTNPDLQDFLTSEVPDASQASESSSESVDLFEISVQRTSKEHPYYDSERAKTDLAVDLKFGYLFMNIKPDVIEAVLSFLTENIPKKLQSQLRGPPNQTEQTSSVHARSRSASKNETESSPKNENIEEKISSQIGDNVRLKLNIEVKQVGIRMIHRSLRLCLAEFVIKDPRAEIILKPQATFFKGKLGNIQLLDTTNYPHTIDSNTDYQKIRPYEIVGVGEKGSSLVEIDFKHFDSKGGKVDSENGSSLNVNVRSIRFNVLHLPILRMVNFFEQQVLGAVHAGNKSQIQFGNTEEVSKTSKSPKKDKSQAEQTLLNPNFMRINVRIDSPIITIKPLPDSIEWIEVHLGDISIHNHQLKSTKRLEITNNKTLDYVYCETISVDVNSMGIWRVQNKKRHQLTRRFDFDLQLERLLYPDEYHILSGEDQEIDDAMVLDAQIPPLIVIVSKDDYKLFAKIAAFNFNYDDGLNELFIWTTPNTESIEKDQPASKSSKKQEDVPADPKESNKII